MERSEKVIDLIKDLRKFREQVKQPEKNAFNPFTKGKYSDLSAVIKSIDAATANTGLSWTQDVRNDPNGVTVQTIIFHDSGEFIEFSPLTMPTGKGTAQDVGSAETYARRYTLQTAFGLVGDADDDANSASSRAPEQRQQRPQTRQQAAPRPAPRQAPQAKRQAPADPPATADEKNKLLDSLKEFARVRNLDGNAVFTSVVRDSGLGQVKWGQMTQSQYKAVSDAFHRMSAVAPDPTPDTSAAPEPAEPPLPF
ncbi:ERF family protein [Lacticaseibacillus hegangensis]|uniref:ERF family protein n=1 Tax=Lacticaseibacillus hegangensis TaxID=2486010 RepID=A0ABW4CWZ7_9LACO|nr:ERF family protein [Lacticaseibacillus hegangensis]